jgi:phosphohistidine phosphatase
LLIPYSKTFSLVCVSRFWQKSPVKIFVMRHGPAEDTSPSGSDAERDLSQSGRDRVRSVAQTLVAQNEQPLLIISSPLVRALQTAEIVASVLTYRGSPSNSNATGVNASVMVSTRRELAPGGNALSLLAELRLARKRRVLLVGHEPDVSVLVSTLAPAASTPRAFMKAMVVGLSVPNAETDADANSGKLQARLRFVLDPKSLLFERHS